MNKKEVSQLLNQLDLPKSKEQLYPIVYDNLHDIAQKLFNRERVDHTLQPTLLVNEAYLNLVDQDQINWQGRTHFFAVGAQAIRRILVHHARSKNAIKRGSGEHQLELEEGIAFTPEKEGMVLDIHEGLEQLSKVHERQATVVELKFFGGLKMQEIADELGVSIKTVEVDWKVAKAWLKKFMKSDL
ncbi:sigma-70 family RNA polymerase sigma factor [Flammeovirga aprica]|uniref:Sigma-70 family RNA polymerase sigma factor n=1 Tax=Flammeovirga aprica JL-4 TaxID=694437 RepID=A0A7X9RU88_9BACT|nr:sigma-70 family RNA polymerase sigma factor [Flammeovirga aprica]NME68805.1 sigma-70 family RNA polymerase sigma factor [Flammeovirga aprica JL-4]